MQLQISDGAGKIIRILNLNGHSAYVVGGAVRDCILGKTPHEFDIATSAKPFEIKKIFPKNFETGSKSGAVTIIEQNECFKITTYRADSVHLGKLSASLVDDMLCRDFTINALAYNENKGIVDCVGGLDDIKNKIIRCVGDPERRFKENPLIMLKAIRFSIVLGFEIDKNTALAIRKYAILIKKVNLEIIRQEIERILRSENPEGIMKLHEYGLLQYIIPELERCFTVAQKNKYHIYNVGEHIIHAVEATPEDIVIRWAALLHDIGKPDCQSIDSSGIIHFFGHHHESMRLADDILHRLRLNEDIRKNILLLIENHDIRIESNPVAVKRVMTRLGEDLFLKLLTLQEADNYAKNHKYLADKLSKLNEVRVIYRKVLSERQPYLVSDLVINNRDLSKLGFRAGREMGDTLRSLLDEVIINPSLNNREYLLKRARQLKKKK